MRLLRMCSTNGLLFLALAVGLVLGFVHPPPFLLIGAELIESLFLKMLRLISLPIVFLAIVSTLAHIESLKEARLWLFKTLKYTLGTTVVAALIGLTLFMLLNPSQTLPSLPSQINGTAEHAIELTTQTNQGYLFFVKKIVPAHLFEPFLEHNVLATTFLATICALALLSLPRQKAAPVLALLRALFEMVLRITTSLMRLMPLAMVAFSLRFAVEISQGRLPLKGLMLYVCCILGANLLQGLVVLPVLLKWKGIAPGKAVRAMFPMLTAAFFSKSSSATLPLSMEVAQNRLGVDPKLARFMLPICSVINMNGCAAFILITTLFVATSEGMAFTYLSALPFVLLSTVAAVGNAGVPMGCFFLTSALLLSMGVSIETMGLILPLYSLFDMVETALNVFSDGSITAVVDRELKEMGASERVAIPTPS